MVIALWLWRLGFAAVFGGLQVELGLGEHGGHLAGHLGCQVGLAIGQKVEVAVKGADNDLFVLQHGNLLKTCAGVCPMIEAA